MVLHTSDIKSISLCSGAGGLDLGIRLALPGTHIVCFVEHEAAACEVLAARIEDGALDDAPIWTDLRTFDGLPWRGKVDLITAGFPCQPFSVAGKQRGTDDPRHLWPHVRRVIEEAAPSIVFLENVPGLLNVRTPDGRYAYEMVRDELEELGFRVTEGLFSAAEVGAPHRRERLFILAHRAGLREGEGIEQPAGLHAAGWRGEDVADARGFASVRSDVQERFISQEPEWQSTQSVRQNWERRVSGISSHGYDLADAGHTERPGGGEPAGRSEGQPCGQPSPQGGDVGDATDGGRQHEQDDRPGVRPAMEGQAKERVEPGDRYGTLAGTGLGQRGTEGRTGAGSTGAVDDAHLSRLEGRERPFGERPNERTACRPSSPFPPGPGDTAAWGRILAARPDLAPALPQSPVRRVADELGAGMDLSRAARLRLTGNGVVPMQAALAFRTLWERP